MQFEVRTPLDRSIGKVDLFSRTDVVSSVPASSVLDESSRELRRPRRGVSFCNHTEHAAVWTRLLYSTLPNTGPQDDASPQGKHLRSPAVWSCFSTSRPSIFRPKQGLTQVVCDRRNRIRDPQCFTPQFVARPSPKMSRRLSWCARTTEDREKLPFRDEFGTCS